MREWYILEGKNAVLFNGSSEEWQVWKETNNTCVNNSKIENIIVNTTFNGCGYRSGECSERPQVFSTSIFDLQPHPYRYPRHYNRYATWEQAEKGHAAAVEMVRRDLSDKESPSRMEVEKKRNRLPDRKGSTVKQRGIVERRSSQNSDGGHISVLRPIHQLLDAYGEFSRILDSEELDAETKVELIKGRLKRDECAA